jgi:hypothetical protein
MGGCAVDEEIRDRATGRDEAADGPGHGPAAAPDRQNGGSDGPTVTVYGPLNAAVIPAENIVTVCAWCPQLHILKLQLRDIDVLVIYKQGKELRILRNGVNLTISHGICEPCRKRMR